MRLVIRLRDELAIEGTVVVNFTCWTMMCRTWKFMFILLLIIIIIFLYPNT